VGGSVHAGSAKAIKILAGQCPQSEACHLMMNEDWVSEKQPGRWYFSPGHRAVCYPAPCNTPSTL